MLSPRRRIPNAGIPVALRFVLALAVPFIAALTVTGTYLGKEVVVAAAWIGLGTIGFLFVQPIVGIAIMTSGYMLAAYPTVFDSFGGLTVNNLLGLGFLVLVAGRVLETRDVSFLRIWPVVVFAVIGLVFLASSFHAADVFPLLQVSRGKRFELDKSTQMAHDFVTRLVFLIFVWVFVRTRRDIRVLHFSFFLSLFAAVPSAILNWMQGTLISGFRAAASLTSGANPNRLAMICLIEVVCWWFWAQARPGLVRRGIALGAIGASILVVFASGSRSGFLGCGVLLVLLQTGPRRFRIPLAHLAAVAVIGALGVLAFVPAESLDRMINFAPDRHTYGYHSTLQRMDTIWLGARMLSDHPVLGVGLGNFREVARQVYLDQYFRPPHNSYLWAAAEGGVLGIVGYLVLFALVWRDLAVVLRLAPRDPEIAHMAAALRVALGIFSFFSVFADIWLNPITYILIGQIITLRRYMESLPAAAAATPLPIRPARPLLAVAS